VSAPVVATALSVPGMRLTDNTLVTCAWVTCAWPPGEGRCTGTADTSRCRPGAAGSSDGCPGPGRARCRGRSPSRSRTAASRCGTRHCPRRPRCQRRNSSRPPRCQPARAPLRSWPRRPASCAHAGRGQRAVDVIGSCLGRHCGLRRL
jgi:hypothetical protein